MKNTPENGSLHPWTDVGSYISLAFAFSWLAWILSIKLHAPEEFLNFGTAGPAFAAIILSRDRRPNPSYSLLRRGMIFCASLLFCWAVLSLHYLWRGSSDLRFSLNPWLLGPAIFPAWIISTVFSKDGGVRCIARRLVHRPNRWSLIALLFYPAIQIIPALAAHLFHLSLIHPEQSGPASAVAVSGDIVFFLYNVLFVAVLEEPGWRGFLLDRLQEKCSPLLASMAVWLPWALWHAPLDYFRPVRFSVVMYLEIRVVFLIPIVIILTWLYNRSSRSIQTTVLFHASMNTFPFILPYFAPGFVLLFVAAAYAIVSDRMWRNHNRKSAAAATSSETS